VKAKDKGAHFDEVSVGEPDGDIKGIKRRTVQHYWIGS
jgi:hypothetical protein